MTGPSKMLLWLRALASALVVAALAAGVPWLLVATVGNPYPDAGIDWARPLTNETLLGLLAALAWVFWAQMIVCLVVETLAEVRTARGAPGDWLTRVPGTFGGQQHLARVLVNSIVAVGLSASGAANVAAPATAANAGWRPIQSSSPDVVAQTPSAAPAARAPHKEDGRTHLVTVGKGDTLWSLAEQHLGSGELWSRIAELNQGRLMPDGAHFTQASTIHPGWTLLLPDSPGRRTDRLTVEAGDTLWELADQEYGDADRWRRLYAANRDQIADPDVIYPGQVLEVPQPPGPRGESGVGSAEKPPRGGKAIPGTSPTSSPPVTDVRGRPSRS